jgi:hypothetical protein
MISAVSVRSLQFIIRMSLLFFLVIRGKKKSPSYFIIIRFLSKMEIHTAHGSNKQDGESVNQKRCTCNIYF